MVFYDQHGRPVAYSEDSLHIYLFTGEPVAYLDGNAVYGFNGKHFGWFENGWIRDLNGFCVFYTEDAAGGPVKPIKCICPIKSVKQIQPIKCIQEIQRIRAVDSLGWSKLSGAQFFGQ